MGQPAQPCLSSRFPYGYEITNERLKMVEKAEEYIKNGGKKFELDVMDLPLELRFLKTN